MGRRTAIAFVALFGLIVWLAVVIGLVAVAVVGANVVHNHAMDRCTATPPGFPRELSQSGTTITVDWKLFPFRYACVYSAPRVGVVERPPP